MVRSIFHLCDWRQIAKVLRVAHEVMAFNETDPVDPDALTAYLSDNGSITHVAVVHSETTTGMLNPPPEIVQAVKRQKCVCIVDAMSSFGGIKMDVAELDIDYLISSPNKCIQGVPGFGFVIAKQSEMERIQGHARSLSLDLYDQWQTMEAQCGKWRYTSPTPSMRKQVLRRKTAYSCPSPDAWNMSFWRIMNSAHKKPMARKHPAIIRI